MLRALDALLRGDLKSYFKYNFMALPVAAAFLGEVFIDIFGKHKKVFHFCFIFTLVINFIYYLYCII